MAGEMRRQIAAAAQGPPEQAAPPSDIFLKNPEVWRRSYSLGLDFVGFQGHFDGHPILPALAQVFLAQDMIQCLVKGPVTVAAITQAKFLAPVPPGSLVTVYGATPKAHEWRLHLTATPAGEAGELDVAFLRLTTVENSHAQ